MIHLGVFYFQFFTFKFIDEFVVQNNLLAKRNVRDYIHQGNLCEVVQSILMIIIISLIS